MDSRMLNLGKKTLSLALTFNCLLSIMYAIGILSGVYTGHWKVYQPYLIDSSFFWILILNSVLNLLPATSVGRVKTGRPWLHHYVYGLFISASSAILTVVFASVSLLSLFTANITSVDINAGRFFFLGGLTLVLDDLPDVSKKMSHFLILLKLKLYRIRKTMHILQILTGGVSIYLLLCVTAWIIQNPQGVTVQNAILVGTLSVTGLISVSSVKRKTWLKVTPEQL